jgi:hypothetical protein
MAFTSVVIHREFQGPKDLTPDMTTLGLQSPANENGAIWVVFARLLVVNYDGSAQNMTVRLRCDGAVPQPDLPFPIADQVSARIPGGGPYSQSVSLQSVLLFNSPEDDLTVFLDGEGYNMRGEHISMIGMNVAGDQQLYDPP